MFYLVLQFIAMNGVLTIQLTMIIIVLDVKFVKPLTIQSISRLVRTQTIENMKIVVKIRKKNQTDQHRPLLDIHLTLIRLPGAHLEPNLFHFLIIRP